MTEHINSRVQPPAKPASRLRAEYLRPAFLVCALVLGLSAVGMSAAIKILDIVLVKELLPLKQPLDLLDKANLGTYKVLKKEKENNEDVIQTLGTEDYIQWTLEDTNVPADSPVRFCALFVTYYGLADKVPHVPDECYIGGGYKLIGSEGVTLEVRKDGKITGIPATYLVFSTADSDSIGATSRFSVFYTFNTNGEYAAGRQGVRMILNRNLFGRHSYFSKVEWKFYNDNAGRIISARKDEAIAAGNRLLAAILPILEEKHWPVDLKIE